MDNVCCICGDHLLEITDRYLQYNHVRRKFELECIECAFKRVGLVWKRK